MSVASSASLQQRISEQLQSLSLLGETLTLRLLELEERLAALEAQWGELDAGEGDGPEQREASRLLAATEDRLARLEELLAEQQLGGSAPARGSVHSLAGGRSPGLNATSSAEPDPFPEEEEQPFMDELSA
jgi:hypothetical protein